MSELLESILCEACGMPLALYSPELVQCLHGHRYHLSGGVLDYTSSLSLANVKEVDERDGQARTYLSHVKVPVHAARFGEFCERAPKNCFENQPVLDLGCGPGPTTAVLLSKGCNVIAVDFSIESLMLNRGDNMTNISRALYVRADLNRIRFAENTAMVLVMSDFLQHLGDQSAQREFLKRVFRSLRPGGLFYLSFFNVNVKNLLRSDIDGSWGGISYTRNRASDVVAMLPDDIVVSERIPMNISHSVAMDRIYSRLPFADWLSRWILLTGFRRFAA
jgi:SAM-dependent methyltransferase